MPTKPRTPALMRIRVAVRGALSRLRESIPDDQELRVLVALSGGADSLALAAAAAAEGRSGGVGVGAIVVDHGLQEGSATVADRARAQAEALGLSPVVVRRVSIDKDPAGPEAAARSARYGAILEVAKEVGASAVLLAHTRDDQAEQVLLSLARGSGTRSIAGIAPQRELSEGVLGLRPLLAEHAWVTRETTVEACRESGLNPWQDPHNEDRAFTRVRVRHEVLPVLTRELGQGVTAALARSADLAREDADALDGWAERVYREALGEWDQERGRDEENPLEVSVSVLGAAPDAIRNRVIRRILVEYFGEHLTRERTLEVASLVTAWRGQGPIQVPGAEVTRAGGTLLFTGAMKSL